MVDRVDTSIAEAYEAALVPGLMAPWGESIAAAAGTKEGMAVLDVACGTGVAARAAARRCGPRGKVTGVDLDRGMLAIADVTSRKEGLSIEYICASAGELPFEAESFDAVMCLQGLQYFPDPAAALSELLRVLRPDAPLVAMTWSAPQSCKAQWAVISALERRSIDAAAARKPFCMADASVLENLARKGGFGRVTVEKAQRLARFPSVASFVESMRRGAPSTRQALERVPAAEWPGFLQEVESSLAEWRRESKLEFPVECNVLEARR